MTICSNCGKENPADASRCAACGAEFSASVSDRDVADAAGNGDELVMLATFNTVAEADMVQELLENNGIMSVIHGETDPIGAAGRAEPISLAVEKQDSVIAQEIYAAFFSGDASAEENPASEDE